MQDKETKKTLTYVLVAGIALLVAIEPWRPAPAKTSVPDQVGQKLFPKFENPLAAKSLEVVVFNEENATVRDFKVAQTNGVWSIPSHSNYPADANEHMAKAATALMDLKILGIASDKLGERKTYGVETPDPKVLKVGMTGVGTRVTIRDGADKVLADLIIGKPVKDAPQLRYVREEGRDAIYTVAVKTDEFSTKFGDWIEKDLLKLNAFDVREISLNDYSTRSGVTPEGQMGLALEKRSEIDLGFDDAKSSWNLIEMREFDPEGKATVVTLTADEQLDNEKLNAMKTALDDLQIVDVERKPAGLSQDLKATDEFVKNREAFVSLQQRGFVPAAAQGEAMQIYSSEGEVTCATKDGVKYVLRFGNLADTGTEESGQADAAAGKEGEAKSNGPSRYLFVTAAFDENMIPKPTMDPVPGEAPAAAEEKPVEPKSDAPAEEATEKPAEEAKPASEDAKPAAEETKPAAEEAKPVPETKTALQEEAKSDAKQEPAESKPAAEAPAEKPGDAAAKPADASAKPADATEAKPAEPDKPTTPEEAAKMAVQKENKRKQDEYDAAIKAGQDKVKQLNDRFADWYYIISDDVYKKIHLGRKDIIQAKQLENPKDAGNLQQIQQGLGEPAIP